MSEARRIGPYEVVREIARGGMGVVFEVRHPNVPRPLALKLILDRRRADPSIDIKRFEREAQLLAQVDRHPNVLKVHQFSQDNGLYFLVTDFIAGDSLAASMPLPPRQAAVIARKLADALAYVHAKGVIHRDLKPQNVLLRAEDPDEPILVDFGLAWSSEVERLTKTNTTVGTPAYMAPEQLAGGGAQLDGRTDVYSLGATLYSALTGDAPFEATSVPELVGKILMEPPPRPSALNPEVPRALDAIVCLALAKDRNARFESAAAMRDDLDRFLAGETPLAVRRIPSPIAVKAKRLGLATVGIAALVTLVAFAVAFGARSARRAAYARSLETAGQAARAAAQARRSSDARARSDALESALSQLVAVPAPAESDPRAHPRLALVAAFLRAELEAGAAGGTATDRDHAIGRATEAVRDYLACAATLGFEATPVKDELLEDVSVREAEIAAGLAGAAPSDLVERLLARPTDSPPRALHLERARAFLRLRRPKRAAAEAELAQGTDAAGLEGRLLLGRAALAQRDLARAREAAAAVLKTGADAAARGARALAAEVELEAGDLDAAEAALGPAPPEPGLDLVAALRLEVMLARRAPAEVVAAEAAALLRRARDGAVVVRAAELLGRAQLFAALESFAPREAAPTFDEALSTLRSVVALVAHPGGADARPQAARALLLLGALESRGGPERASLADRAAEMDPASVRVALARFEASREAPAPAREKVAAALVELSSGLADPAAAGALAELAAVLGRQPGHELGSALPALERGAREASLPAERAGFALLADALGREGGRPRPELARSVLPLLDATGEVDGRLLEIGRERVGFLRTVEAFALNLAAVESARQPKLDGETEGVSELNRVIQAIHGSRARGDAVVALSALDLALALSPGLGAAREARAETVSSLASEPRGDVTSLVPETAEPSPAVKHLLQTRPLATLAAGALADLDAAESPVGTLAEGRSRLVRGRLLAVLGKLPEAATELEHAGELGARAFAETSAPGVAEPSLAVLGEAQRVRAAAVFERALVLERASSPEASAARDVAFADLRERGRKGLEARSLRKALGKLSGDMASMASQDVVDNISRVRFRTSGAQLLAPLEEDALDTCCGADMDLGMVARAWTTLHRVTILHGCLPFAYLNWAPRRFYAFLSGIDNGTGAALFTVDIFDQLASEAPPDDAVAVLAQADRRIYGLPLGPRARREVAQVALAAAQLREAQRRAPGCASIYQSRAVLAAAAGELDQARALFARFREIGASGNVVPTEYLLFETAIYGRFGYKDAAKKLLERFLKDAPPDPDFEAGIVDTPTFAGCREFPEVLALLRKVKERFPPRR